MSTANYVIICNGRIDYATATDQGAKIRALSQAAVNLLSHIEVTQPHALSEADTKPISDLQHFLMDNAATITDERLSLCATEMFNYLDALEDKTETRGGQARDRDV